MSASVSEMIGQASRVLVDRVREGRGSGLPAALRPKNLPQAYGIQQAVSRELGAIGGWQVCTAPPGMGLASAPLPVSSLHPDLGHVIIMKARPMRLRPALAFRVGESLAEYDAPFEESRVAAAIASTHPALLVSDSSLDESGGSDALIAIARSCATIGLVFGSPTPGLPQPGMAELAVVDWPAAKRKRLLGTVPIGDFLPSLTWLANAGAAWAGGLLVGQMVAIALPAGAIPFQVGAWLKLIVGDFGKVEIRTKKA